MTTLEARAYQIYIEARGSTDFIVGVDSFDKLRVNAAPEAQGFYYFQNEEKLS